MRPTTTEQRVTDEGDLTTTPTEAQHGLVVTEYTQFGADIEVEVPDQDQATEMTSRSCGST